MNKTRLLFFIFIILFISCSSHKYSEVLIKVENKEYVDFNRYYYYFFNNANHSNDTLNDFINKEFCGRLSKNLSIKIENYNEEIFKSKNLRNLLFEVDYVLNFNGDNFYQSSFLELDINLVVIDNLEREAIFKGQYSDRINLEYDNKEKIKKLRLILNRLAYKISIDLIKQPKTEYRKVLY